MRVSVAVISALLLIAASRLTQAADQRVWDRCKDVNNAVAADENITACNSILNDPKETARNRAGAYSNRCGLWITKKDPDRALSDCNQAIRLDPKNAFAFNGRGAVYGEKLDYDRAIADYNEAIQLDPKLALAFYNRGNAYRNRGDLDRALADYNEAIRLDPKNAFAFNGRGVVYRDKGDLDRAVADYNEAIRLDPKNALLFSFRGWANLYGGSLAKALADLEQASALDPKDAYTALWLDIVTTRSNLPSRLRQAVSQVDMTKWPAPLIRLFLGQMTPAAVLAAADDADLSRKKGQLCEVNFYSGALALRRGRRRKPQGCSGLRRTIARALLSNGAPLTPSLRPSGSPPESMGRMASPLFRWEGLPMWDSTVIPHSRSIDVIAVRV